VRRGDRVGMFYSSANFGRGGLHRPAPLPTSPAQPAPRFGGSGAHYCVGRTSPGWRSS
jgi:hypothetical protein